LGSTRAVVTLAENGYNVVEHNDYFPFGGRWNAGSSAISDNRFRFSGKEGQGLFGLPYTDFGFRMYDPAIGRWITQDPLAEEYYPFSPYAYTANNPIKFIDPNGLWIEVWGDGICYQWRERYDGIWDFYGETDGDMKGLAYSGMDSFINSLRDALNGIMSGGPTGWGLVSDVAGNLNNTVTIVNGANLRGSYTTNGGTTIFWKPTGTPVPVLNGTLAANPFADLALELAHVQVWWDDGKIDAGTWYTKSDGQKIDNSELQSTHVENQVRGEMGLLTRTFYTLDVKPGTMINLSPKIATELGMSLFFDTSGNITFPGWGQGYKYGKRKP
jgi:RHS repeat-associated protein